jgi:hypothetical protein
VVKQRDLERHILRRGRGFAPAAGVPYRCQSRPAILNVSNEVEVEENYRERARHVGTDLRSRSTSLVSVVRLQSWPLVGHQKHRLIITARSLERYERLYSGSKRGRSSYQGCSGPRSGSVYEVDLLARETPVWARPALDPDSDEATNFYFCGRF